MKQHRTNLSYMRNTKVPFRNEDGRSLPIERTILENTTPTKNGSGSGYQYGGSLYPTPIPRIIIPAITSDNINVTHQIEFSKPTPNDTANWCSVYPDHTDIGIYTRDLKDYPSNDLPSGGGCPCNPCRISPSEMVLTYFNLDNYSNPSSGSVRLYWINKANPDVSLHEGIWTVPSPNPEWTYWWYRGWSFIGRFDWEIKLPGEYQCGIQTSWGDAIIDFTVVDTSCKQPLCSLKIP